MSRRRSTPVKDQGYSWVVLAASTAICAMFGAGFSTIGVYFVEFVEYFQVDKTELGWVGVCQLSLLGIAGLIAGPVVKVFGCRVSVSIGTMFLAVGYISSAFLDDLRILYFTFGIITGTGYGFYIVTAPVMVQRYFDRLRSTANGILLAGNSIGAFIWPPFVEWLIQMYTWKGAMLIQAGILMHSFVFAGLLRPFPEDHSQVTASQSSERNRQSGEMNLESDNDSKLLHREEAQKKLANKSGPNCHSKWCCSALDISLLKDRAFLLFCLGMFVTHIGHFGIFSFLPLRAVALGVTKQQAALLMSIMAAFGGVSRVLMGVIGDRVAPQRALWCGVTTIIIGILGVLSALLTEYWMLACYVALYGIIGACFATFQATLVVDILGLDNVANGMGLLMVFVGLSNFILFPISGILLDSTHNAAYPFFLVGFSQIVGGILFCAVHCLLTRRRHRQHREANAISVEVHTQYKVEKEKGAIS